MSKLPRRTALMAALLVVSAATAATATAAQAAPPPPDTAAAARVIAAAIDAAGPANDKVATCPAGDITGLLAKAPPELGLSRSVNDPRQTSFTQAGATTITCTRLDGDVFGTVYMGEPFSGDLRTTLEGALDSGFVTSFAPTITVANGTLVAYCSRSADGSGTGFCEADWMDANVIYGVSAFSPTVNARLVSDWLVSILGDLNTAVISNAAVISGGSATAGDASLQTIAAGTNFRQMLTEAAQQVGSNRGALSTCPFGTAEAVLAKAPAGVDTAALQGTLQIQLFPVKDQQAIGCVIMKGTRPALIWGAVTAHSGDHRAVAESLAAGPLTFAPDLPFRGGTQYTYCEDNATTTLQNYCETDWLDANIEYVLSVVGTEITAEQVSAWLQSMLDDVNAAATTNGLDGRSRQ